MSLYIAKIWGLKLGKDLLGVRIKTTDNSLYDLELDAFVEEVGGDIKKLQPLPLQEFGDKLMTEEEYYSGQLIEDASKDEILLGQLKQAMDFIKEKNERIQKQKDKKKVEEYKQSYYTYIPDKWLKEFAQYHLDHFEGNKNIYSSLSDKQVGIIKEYSRWRSKILFDEQNYSKRLVSNPKKAQQLLDLMGNAKDWMYDGTVDTGYKGGSYCELGHPLRYEHYAFSPTLNKQIIFGSTCISDFFEVDEKLLKNIMQAQEVILKEIKAIVFILNTGKFQEYKEDYVELWDVLKAFKGDFNSKLKNGSGWAKFMGNFDHFKLPLTRSMLFNYRRLLKYYNNKEEAEETYKERVEEVITALTKGGIQESVARKLMENRYPYTIARDAQHLLLTKNFLSPYVQGVLPILPMLDHISFQMMMGFDVSRLSQQTLNQLTAELRKDKILNLEDQVNLGILTQLLNCEHIEHVTSIPLVFDAELKGRIKEFIVRRDYYKDAVKYSKEGLLASAFTRYPHLKSLLKENKEGVADSTSQAERPSIVPSNEPPKDTIPAKENNTNGIAPDTLVNKYHFISQNIEKLTEAEAKTFNNNISKESMEVNPAHADKNTQFSQAFVENVYNRVLKRMGKTAPTKSNQTDVTRSAIEYYELTPELDGILSRIIEAGSANLLPRTHFVFKVIPTIQSTGKMSEKQKKFVDDALSRITTK